MLDPALWLTDFRSLRVGGASTLAAGLTALLGDNGQGKTNLLEAVGWLATLGVVPGRADRGAGPAGRRPRR